jgi:2-isopropylmalate synthase
MKKRIQVYDTTLRDGAQGEGVSFSDSGKIRLVRRLDEFGVDYAEGGYAGSNQREIKFFAAVQREELQHLKIVAFGATRRAGKRVQNDSYVRALLEAETPAVTVVGKTSRLHVREVLRATPQENRAMISDTIAYLKDSGREVFFDAEHFFDGYKEDPDFVMRSLEAAVKAGVDAIVLCDTNGGCLPSEIYKITRATVRALPVAVGIHTHNDAGLAVANALEGVRAGAAQVQGTVNGFGERCGNADLCTIIPNLQLKMGRRCVSPENLTSLRELSLFADDLVNLSTNKKAPYVGESAFSHKAGPHVNAVRKNPVTFEHIPPEQVGNERRILLSELSGGSSILLKAIEVGARDKASPQNTKRVLKALKEMESKGYAFESADASFRILIQKALKQHKPFFELLGFRVMVEKRGKGEATLSEATVKVRVNGQEELTVAEGDGPVNALDGALRKALGRFYPEISEVVLRDFRVRILDPEEATAAKTRVLIESSDGTANWGTVGVSENIIEASWEALVDSVEYKLFREEEKSAE